MRLTQALELAAQGTPQDISAERSPEAVAFSSRLQYPAVQLPEPALPKEGTPGPFQQKTSLNHTPRYRGG